MGDYLGVHMEAAHEYDYSRTQKPPPVPGVEALIDGKKILIRFTCSPVAVAKQSHTHKNQYHTIRTPVGARFVDLLMGSHD